MKKIVLASTSIYRQAQLKTLGIAFTAEKPLIDEEKEKDTSLSPKDLALKLSFLKAQSLAKPNQITIGGDQLVSFENQILGKPGSIEKAIQQITKMQNQTHELITALTIFDGPENFKQVLNITKMKLKKLTPEQIKKYIELDNPIDCAGSYKIEKHGVQIIEAIETSDFTAIQGLPLLELSQVLTQMGIAIP
jgi:septum formation protein